MCSHATHLTVSPFVQGDFQPGRRDRLALADRWIAWPQPLWFGDQLHAGRQGRAVFERDAAAQGGQIAVLRRSLDLHVIHLTGALARLGELRLQFAVIG